MKTTTPVLLVLVSGLAACVATETVPSPGMRYADDDSSMRLIEGPGVAPPANDISESKRREWLDAQRPRAEYVPVREVYVEHEPVRYVHDYDYYDRRYDGYHDWYLPISLSLGYWGGRWGRHHGGGWSWGLGWRSGWGW